jgi:V/A-type H+-transporting ATPase subunit D
MVQIKFTKSELRNQQLKLTQLNRYLPTLQLKKAMLQSEVNAANVEVDELTAIYEAEKKEAETFQSLLSTDLSSEFLESLVVVEVIKEYESIAGVEIPHFKKVVFSEVSYALFDTPFWMDDALMYLKALIASKEKIRVAQEKKRLLEQELREVSIRVNLFEKIMIPRTMQNIKKIKVFLGDQQLAAISQAKVAKRKILEKIG